MTRNGDDKVTPALLRQYIDNDIREIKMYKGAREILEGIRIFDCANDGELSIK